jgi:CBS domain-containing protein
MTTELVTVTPEEYLNTVTRIFSQNGFHHIPVVGKGRRLKGIISREDFQRMTFYFFQKAKNGNENVLKKDALQAADIMTPHPVTLDPDDSIGLAADIFLANRFHALPVVEDDQLVGIVTSHDLIELAYKTSYKALSEEQPI